MSALPLAPLNRLTWVRFGESVSVQQVPVKEGNITLFLQQLRSRTLCTFVKTSSSALFKVGLLCSFYSRFIQEHFLRL